jgi:DNA modification methylase
MTGRGFLPADAAMERFQLLSGDCHEVLSDLPAGGAACVVSDPPYAVTKLAWDKPLDWPAVWAQLHRVTAPTANLILFAQQPFATDLIASNRPAFRYELIWRKSRATGFLDAHCRPMRAHENILLFCRQWRGAGNRMLATYHPQMTPGKPYSKRRAGDRRGNCAAHYGSTSDPHKPTVNLSGDRFPTSIMEFISWKNPCGHPTEKPVDLLRWLIRSYSNPGDLILDFCCGTGSTGVAALVEGRRFLGVERAPDLVEVARRRLDTVATPSAPSATVAS